MKLFLTGGGDQENFLQLDQKFIAEVPEQAKLLLIPMALDEEEYDEALERIQDVFNSNKIQTIDLCRNLSLMTKENLLSYDALIFEGGNTFQLIHALRECSFFSYLKVFCEEDKIIYADSAGAIVLGSDVQTAFLGDDGDEDELKLQDYRGIGVLNEWSLHCHFEASEIEDVQELMYSTGSTVICLPEPCGIYYDGKAIEAFGDTPITILNFAGIETLSDRKHRKL